MSNRIIDVLALCGGGGVRWLESLSGRDRQELIEMFRWRATAVSTREYYAMDGVIRDWILDHGGDQTCQFVPRYERIDAE